MDGIAIEYSPTSNALLAYNLWFKMYYQPDSYCLDPYRLPLSVYPQLKYDGRLFCSLVQDKNPAMEEPYPSGTRAKRLNPDTIRLLAGTVMDIPLFSNPSGSPVYHILFDKQFGGIDPFE